MSIQISFNVGAEADADFARAPSKVVIVMGAMMLL